MKNHNMYGRNSTGNAICAEFFCTTSIQNIASNTYLTRYAQGHADMHTDLHVVSVLSV